jgi:hypothetical protein
MSVHEYLRYLRRDETRDVYVQFGCAVSFTFFKIHLTDFPYPANIITLITVCSRHSYNKMYYNGIRYIILFFPI